MNDSMNDDEVLSNFLYGGMIPHSSFNAWMRRLGVPARVLNGYFWLVKSPHGELRTSPLATSVSWQVGPKRERPTNPFDTAQSFAAYLREFGYTAEATAFESEVAAWVLKAIPGRTRP